MTFAAGASGECTRGRQECQIVAEGPAKHHFTSASTPVEGHVKIGLGLFDRPSARNLPRTLSLRPPQPRTILGMERTTTMTTTTDDARNASSISALTEQEACSGHAEADWSDEELLLCYRTTQRRSLFDEIVHRYQRELYAYLRRYLGDADLAEDVFQATFLRVHLKCKQFDAGRKVRPWLYAIATNAAIDAQRSVGRHRSVSLERENAQGTAKARLTDMLVSPHPGPLAEVSRLESGEWVQQALDELSDQLRNVVNLVYYQGLKYREAAEVLEVPVGTVKSRLHAAVRKLGELWNETHTQ